MALPGSSGLAVGGPEQSGMLKTRSPLPGTSRSVSVKSRSSDSPSTSTNPAWVHYTDEELLKVRLCDLGVSIRGTPIAKRIAGVHEELRARNIDFRPHTWLSSEWFSPDGVPGIAIPFYLAHPRLMKLEDRQMLEVEGGSEAWFMRLLRHEVGHAIDNAYRLRRRRTWREVFGRASQPYPKYYQPRPYSKRFVLHLDYWYAQGHPCEDFAETFAVWLTPDSNWEKRYRGWPAFKKLKYVDALMRQIAGRRPPVTSRERVDPLRQLRITLQDFYTRKRARYGTEFPDFYDRDLRRLFSETADPSVSESAAGFLRRIRPEIRSLVARWTGQYQYTIDQVLRELISRSRELKLRVDGVSEQTKLEASVFLTVQTMNYLHSGRHRIFL